MRLKGLVWAGACLFWALLTGADSPALLTTAERSGYTATSTHEEVMAFCRALAEKSDRVRLADLGQSMEGRSLPLLILSRTGLDSAEEARRSGKPAILAVGTIHGGEVCGKEALLQLARELAREEAPAVLDQFVLLLAPLLNADGNERFSTNNRPHQNGPIQGVGKRGNAAGLDLNRDFMKLEAPETRALVRLFNQWNPILVIDTHTTDGSQHRYTVTYDGPRHPGGDAKVQRFVRQTFLPAVGSHLLEQSGYDSFLYGNFKENHTRWLSYPALPRYGVQYVGLRGRIGVLSEAYVYASYRDRVLATKALVESCLAVALQEKEQIAELLRQARTRSVAAGEKGRGTVPLQTRLAASNRPIRVKGYADQEAEGPPSALAVPKDHRVEQWSRSEVVQSASFPFAYLLPPSLSKVLTNLLTHGIEVEELREDLDLELETYTVVRVVQSAQPFQEHYLNSLTASPRRRTCRVEAGTVVVRTGQALGQLAACLLEPESEDGLAAWGFFGEAVAPGKDFPVHRLPKPVFLRTASVRPLPEDRKLHQRVTFDTLHGARRPNFHGSPARASGWLKKGGSYMEIRGGQLHRVDPVTGRGRPYFSRNKVAQALASLAGIDEKRAGEISRRTSFEMNPDQTGALFQHGDDLYFFRFDGSQALRLTRSPGREELAEFSPDGRFVAYVRDQNLYLVDLATQTERPLTTDGGGPIRNGKASWVYFEEVYDRNWTAFWWNPDSSCLAFHRFDESALPTFHALNTLALHSQLESMRHPKVGDPNPAVQLGVVSIAGGPARWVDLSAYTNDLLISRVAWMPHGRTLYFHVQDRAQTWLDGQVWDVGDGPPRQLFRETTEAWVDDPGEPHFLKTGDLILPSARTGWRHLYRFDPEELTWLPLTSGEWEVRRLHLVDEPNGWLYFTATRDSAIAENLYRCQLDGSSLERLTPEPGQHRPSLDPGGAFFIDTTSDYRTPEKVLLRKTDGTLLRTIDTNPVHLLEEFDFGPAELLQIQCQDRFLLEASLVKPPDFRPDRRYPVWFMTYAGPAAPTIRNAWGGGFVRDQMLAGMGLIVFRLDPRSASGKGSRSAWTAYRQLGCQELADITEGLEWLKEKPYIDGARIGMSGHSYGGFMTAFALTHSTLFAAGIAGAPVTDWRYYDTIYTERYMGTLENNPDGYDKTSVVKAASNLHGRLLILHGMMDDNVHLQNATALADALQRADKDFEMMFYPTMKHGLYGAHYDRLLVDFVRRTLLLQGGSVAKNEQE